MYQWHAVISERPFSLASYIHVKWQRNGRSSSFSCSRSGWCWLELQGTAGLARSVLNSWGLICFRLQERHHRKVRGVDWSPWFREHSNSAIIQNPAVLLQYIPALAFCQYSSPLNLLTVCIREGSKIPVDNSLFFALDICLNCASAWIRSLFRKCVNWKWHEVNIASQRDWKRKREPGPKTKCTGWLQSFARWLKGSKADTSLTE